MPIYDYRCTECGHELLNVKRTVAERNTKAPKHCGKPMQIIIRPSRDVFMDYFEDYDCPVTGARVTSKRQRKDIMARHDLVEQGEIKLRSVREF